MPSHRKLRLCRFLCLAVCALLIPLALAQPIPIAPPQDNQPQDASPYDVAPNDTMPQDAPLQDDNLEELRDKSRIEAMTNEKLDELIAEAFDKAQIQGKLGYWQIDLSEANEKEPAQDDQAGEEPAEEEPTEEVGPGADERLPAMMLVLTDKAADRMRIMMPIRPFDPERIDDLRFAMHANYDRALDARYAIHEGVLWSAFIHPLSSLTSSDFAAALRQVQQLRKNTGTTYSSGELLFDGQSPVPPAEEAEQEDEEPERQLLDPDEFT